MFEEQEDNLDVLFKNLDVLFKGLLKLHFLLPHNRFNQNNSLQTLFQTSELNKMNSKLEKQNCNQIDKKDNDVLDEVIINQHQYNHSLDEISTLFELRSALEQVDHPLRYLSNKLVFSSSIEVEPCSNGKIMLIGEAPGEEEDKQGVPFVGMSGQLLEQALETIDLKRHRDFYIINIVPFRPPANRTPNAKEVEFFMPFVKKHIELIKPKLIILVGATAYKAFYGDKVSISAIRGNFLPWEGINEHSFPVFVVFHPSYLLRVPSAKKLMWHDLITLRKYLDKN